VSAITERIPHPTAGDLRRFVKGPDFPTGAIIYGKEGIKDVYEKGRGRIVMRARAVIEEKESSGKHQIVVTEIPFQVNKARLIEDIARLVNDKKLEGISDLRDESDRDGMRIVIELKRDAVPGVVLNQLYKHTAMQSTFGAIMLALVDGVPREMPLTELLQHFIDHRRVIPAGPSSSWIAPRQRAHPRRPRSPSTRRGGSRSSTGRTRRRGRRSAQALQALREAVGRDPEHAPGPAHGTRDHQA
jgi:DNA gyrase/topoisomerase IV subunit A